MNRRSKIIVSVVGIFIVLLALVGITYGYFLTRVEGNTNINSINLVTANLKLEYSEDTNQIIVADNIHPNYSVEKIFYATNKGNMTVEYAVTLENVVNEFSRKEDLVYTLKCESLNSETGVTNGSCNELTEEVSYPSATDLAPVIKNSIDVNTTHKYTLKITFKEMNVDQSIDMGKTFSGLVNIRDIKSLSLSDQTLLSLGLTVNSSTPNFSQPTNTSGVFAAEDNYGTSYYFRGDVSNNNVVFGQEPEKVYEEYCYIENPDGPPHGYIDTNTGTIYEDEMECYENTATTCDYYYPEHCYDTYDECSINNTNIAIEHPCYGKGESIEYNDINWKIIRINGDGTLRLILTQGMLTQGILDYDGYDIYYGNAQYLQSTVKTYVDDWYREKLLENYDSYISKNTMFCNDINYYETYYPTYNENEDLIDNSTVQVVKYDFVRRMSNPTFYCNTPRTGQTHGETQLTVNTGLDYPIALITADEALMAGVEIPNNYLSKILEKNYIDAWGAWTMTPTVGIFDLNSDGERTNIEHVNVFYNNGLSTYYAQYMNMSPYDLYPVINLTADTAKALMWDETANTYKINQNN